ncbi:hypothetical protein K438DRAFT_1762170 [Mycena galopus ATCC 62051]|nr:hypothetical protein K438DRAFT_1762170 [Mycena galopus ATCC 62051]
MKVARIRRGTPLRPRARFLESSTFSFYKHFKWTHAFIFLKIVLSKMLFEVSSTILAQKTHLATSTTLAAIMIFTSQCFARPGIAVLSGAHSCGEFTRQAWVSYWSEVRKRRTCHLAWHANWSAREDEALVDFFPNPNIVTVSADCQGFYYLCLAPNGSLVPVPAPPSATTTGTTSTQAEADAEMLARFSRRKNKEGPCEGKRREPTRPSVAAAAVSQNTKASKSALARDGVPQKLSQPPAKRRC